MSYDIYLKDPSSGETVILARPHNLTGGTYAVGGTNEAWLNITYNYAPHFKKVFGAKGIRTIYGMSAEESYPLLEKGINELDRSPDENYWAPTEGNARKALIDLLELGLMCPKAIWSGD